MARVGSFTESIVLASLLAAALFAPRPAHAGPPKPKPVIGQLVLDGGTPAPVTGFGWEVTADSSWTKGSGASVGKPQPGKLRMQKPIDGNSGAELQNIVLGSAFKNAVLTVTSGKGNTATTMVYELTELYVTGVSQSAADGLTSEDLSLVFKTVKWTFTDASGGSTTGTWDVAPATP